MKYTVVIRTLTGEGDKYKALLDSIKSQTLQPENIYIVQPHGYEPPATRLGTETFIHCNKGMWEQRIFGLQYCYNQPQHPEYMLVCDDDVAFEPDFAAELLQIASEYNIDLLVPIEDFHRPARQNFISAIFGERTENKTSPFKITIKPNGRHSVNNSLPQNVNPTQSGLFQCFFMRTDIVPALRLEEERWLDQTRYAWPDDQVFFYKAYLMGMRTFSCKKPSYMHLDGRAGVTDLQREFDGIYSYTRNIRIFFRRFIIPSRRNSMQRSLARISFARYCSMQCLLHIVRALKHRNTQYIKIYWKGVKDSRRN